MSSHRATRLICVLTFLCFTRPAVTQNTPPADLDAYVARTMKMFEVPGDDLVYVLLLFPFPVELALSACL